jgi:hypothetical protein
MNWRRLYATVEICFTVGLFALCGAGLWSFVVAGLCRIIFELGDNESMLWVGLPLFIGINIWLIRVLPKSLRKAGIISDEPERFGPWFKP